MHFSTIFLINCMCMLREVGFSLPGLLRGLALLSCQVGSYHGNIKSFSLRKSITSSSALIMAFEGHVILVQCSLNKLDAATYTWELSGLVTLRPLVVPERTHSFGLLNLLVLASNLSSMALSCFNLLVKTTLDSLCKTCMYNSLCMV